MPNAVSKHAVVVSPEPKEPMPHSKKKVVSSTTVLPIATSGTTAATGSETPTTTGSATTSSYTLVAPPPDVTSLVVPTGFQPYDLTLYRGYRLKAAQVTLIPPVVGELSAAGPSYASTFGCVVPGADEVAEKLNRASQWIATRDAIEAFLRYAMTYEAMAVKDAVLVLDLVSAQFLVSEAANPASIAGFSALAKLLDVPKTFGKRAASSRSKSVKAKAKAAADTPATGGAAASPAATTPVTTAPAVTPANGGAAH